MRYLATLLLLVSLSANAEVQQNSMPVFCGLTTELISAIRDKYNETLVWSGVESNGNIASLWMNKDKSTYTILKTSPDGKASCAISAGVPSPEA